jgi:hypothetical protein
MPRTPPKMAAAKYNEAPARTRFTLDFLIDDQSMACGRKREGLQP